MLENRYLIVAPLLVAICCLLAFLRYQAWGCKVIRLYSKAAAAVLLTVSTGIVMYLLIADSIRGIAQWLIDQGLMVDALSEILMPTMVVGGIGIIFALITGSLMIAANDSGRRRAEAQAKAQRTACLTAGSSEAMSHCLIAVDDVHPCGYYITERILLKDSDLVDALSNAHGETVYIGRDGQLTSQRQHEWSVPGTLLTVPALHVSFITTEAPAMDEKVI